MKNRYLYSVEINPGSSNGKKFMVFAETDAEALKEAIDWFVDSSDIKLSIIKCEKVKAEILEV